MKKKLLFMPLAAAVLILAACPSLDSIVIGEPDIAGQADGVYEGKSSVGPVRVTVEVTVKDKTMADIAITRHFNGRGKKAESITDEILKAQSLQVDAVSGATASSKAILKAVENALASK